MSENLPVSLQNLTTYVAPRDMPHFGGLQFKIPRKHSEAAVVVYVSGLSEKKIQPLVIATTPDLLYLGSAHGAEWHKSYQEIRDVDDVDMRIIVPVPTSSGGVMDMPMNRAKGIQLSFDTDYSGTARLKLAFTNQHQATKWVAIIEAAREDYQARDRK